MITKIVGIILLLLIIAFFVGYSFLNQGKNNAMVDNYKSFREDYKGIAMTAMGLHKTNALSKEAIVIIAVDESRKIIDARLSVGGDLEGSSWRTAHEFIGIDVPQYIEKMDRKIREDDRLMPKERALLMAARRIMKEE